MPTQNVGL